MISPTNSYANPFFSNFFTIVFLLKTFLVNIIIILSSKMLLYVGKALFFSLTIFVVILIV